jgi:hypothetical protein
MNNTISYVVSFALMLPIQGQKRSASYPEESRSVLSADGRYALSNANHEGGAPNHELVLIDNKTRSSSKVISYTRHIRVAWAPSGHAFFVTNYDGSDSSVCLVGSVSISLSVNDVSQLLSEWSKSRLSRKEPGDHLYCEVTKWINESQILLRVHGYGNDHSPNVVEQYMYDLVKRTFDAVKSSPSH